ncbi:MAG: HemK2/MTQ2 family protein methyltransferase [Candidatus Diapherotrites archaeon]
MTTKSFWNKIELDVFDSVYEPREDSFLLAEALHVPKNSTFLDMGCGCGIQSVSVLHQGAQSALCVDVNAKAVENAVHNASKFGKCKGRESNLFANVPEKFDCIAFNAPYVVSESIQERADDGGKRGREVLNRFLRQMPEHLNARGACYFVQSSLNGETETKKLLEELKLKGEIVAREKTAFEELQAWRVEK